MSIAGMRVTRTRMDNPNPYYKRGEYSKTEKYEKILKIIENEIYYIENNKQDETLDRICIEELKTIKNLIHNITPPKEFNYYYEHTRNSMEQIAQILPELGGISQLDEMLKEKVKCIRNTIWKFEHCENYHNLYVKDALIYSRKL